jgi:HAMP domain-containing protein
VTDDLVKRLRERTDLRMMTASLPPQPVKDWLCQEAADRIEQLEAALREIAQAVGDPAAYWIPRAELGEKKNGH